MRKKKNSRSLVIQVIIKSRNKQIEEDIELIASVDYYLKQSKRENDKYKVIEIIERCQKCVCLEDVKVLESLLDFDIRRYIFERAEYYLGVSRYDVMTIADVDKFIRKSVPSQVVMSRKSRYPKIDYDDLRKVIVNSR